MSDLNVPFADDASQASRSSLSGSLLDRIRAQRERVTTTNPEPLNVPNYAPVETNAAESSGSGWAPNFSLPRLGSSAGNADATVSLLGEDQDGEGYSMTGYFQTFVQDVYNAFRSVHPAAQGFIVVFLVILALKLLL